MAPPTISPGSYECVVIGAGHNGLICAAYLAAAGRKVLVLEAGAEVGGAALTREFSPGYRVSAAAHLLHLMPSSIVQDLSLHRHGLVLAGSQLPTTALSDAGPLTLSGGPEVALAGATAADAKAYPEYVARLRRLAAALRPLLEQAPPRLDSSAWSDRWALMKIGVRIRRLGRRDMRELLRIGAMNVYDLLQEHFASPLLKGALAFDAVLGTNFGPRSPGTVLTLLYRLAAEGGAGANGLCQVRGGMGALSKALAQAAQIAGAEIRTNAEVQRLVVDADRVAGVQLRSGEIIAATAVASSVDPHTTFLRLLGAEHLDTGFLRRITHLRSRGLAAKLHLALSDLPAFDGVPPAALGGRLLIAPSMEYLERAYNFSKYGEASAAPALEITVPTVRDPSLAPAGRHVLSAIVQYAPHTLKHGWDGNRQSFTNAAIAAIAAHAPRLRSLIAAAELLTPADLEQQFRIHGGHWHHAELAFDQFFMVRPVPGAAQYRAPVDGLFLCGAGSHPGGGVMGNAGRNAARQILREAA
jgi:phytoene dehydrogenase-like protein